MRAIPIDARRYAWSHGNALWIMGLPLSAYLEDVDGAAAAGQDGLARRMGRAVGEACAVVLALGDCDARPIPHPTVRAAWALERVVDPELRERCWELVRGAGSSAEEIAARCEQLVSRVREQMLPVPDPLTPEGYFPALALAREWMELLDAVGEPDFLPRRWKRG
jgi:hypothetical protein